MNGVLHGLGRGEKKSAQNVRTVAPLENPYMRPWTLTTVSLSLFSYTYKLNLNDRNTPRYTRYSKL